MCPAVRARGSWPPPGAHASRKALSSSPARRVWSKVPPVRGHDGDRRTSAKWSQNKVSQPPLGDPVQVDAAAAVGEPPAEVLGEDVAGLPGLLGRDVEGMQAGRDGGRDAGAIAAGCLTQAGVAGVQVGEGAQAAVAAVVGKALDRGQFPLPVLPPGVPVHAPLDLGPQQRVQAPEVDLVGPQHRRGRRAPAAEGRLVGVPDGDGLSGAPVAGAPLARQDGAPRAAFPLVARVVP